MIHGKTSTLDYGVVDDPNATFWINNINFDTVSTTTVVMQIGDSGGAVTDMNEDDFHGINKGIDNFSAYYIPWENVEAQLGL